MLLSNRKWKKSLESSTKSIPSPSRAKQTETSPSGHLIRSNSLWMQKNKPTFKEHPQEEVATMLAKMSRRLFAHCSKNISQKKSPLNTNKDSSAITISNLRRKTISFISSSWSSWEPRGRLVTKRSKKSSPKSKLKLGSMPVTQKKG